jgi:hypothetical protein
MNLTEMMSTPNDSIIDHSWWTEGLKEEGKPTFDPVAEGIKKRNNIKPALAIEFGNAGPNIDPNEPAGVVQRNVPKDALSGTTGVIMFARDQMNRGKMGKSLVSALKNRFDAQTLAASADGLKQQLSLQGIVGCIAVDGRGYKSCKDAIRAASHSPYARHIKRVIGCCCGDAQMLPIAEGRFLTEQDLSAVGNPIDAFMQKDVVASTQLVAHCRSTLLPILAAIGDLDNNEMNSLIIDLGNLSGLPQTISAQIKSGKFASNLSAIRAAFMWLDAQKTKAEDSKYAEKVDSAQFIVDNPGQEVVLGAEAVGDIDDLALMNVDQDVVLDTASLGSLEDVAMEQFREEEFEGGDVVDIVEPVVVPPPLDVQMSPSIQIE